MRKLRYFTFLFAAAFFLIPPAARAQATPNEIKLLTQNTGWALLYGRLYWTNDFGQDWRNITPPGAKPGAGKYSIADVFFLNTQDGWALLRNAENDGGPYGGWSFDLAATGDAGITWSVTPVAIPNWDPKSSTLGGSGTIDFVDAVHGWVDLSLQSSSAANWGRLLATSDAGATWRTVPAPIGFGEVRFISTQTGWVAGGPGGTELVVTRDGGKTWQHVSVQAPTQAAKAPYAHYFAPHFLGSRRGFLPVSFNRSVLAVFRTGNGGKTWHPAAVLTAPPGLSLGDAPTMSLADSALLVPVRGRGGALRLHSFPLGAAGGAVTAAWPSRTRLWPQLAPLTEASFADQTRGWVLAGRLFATTDGGRTWTDVTPKPPPAPVHTGIPPKGKQSKNSSE